MRALQITAPGTLEIVERPDPTPGPDQAVVQVDVGGICGSDLAYWARGVSGTAVMSHPFILGHEVAGRVVAVGSDQARDLVGRPVTVHPARTYGPLPERLAGRDNLHPDLTYLGSAARVPHTDGGFAQQIVVDLAQLVELPDGLPIERAVLAEPLGVALHACHRAGDLRGAHVLVSGVGPVGLLVVLAAKYRGAARVTALDINPAALQRAASLGADDCATSLDELSPAAVGEVTVGFEAAGAPASLTNVIGAVARGGVVVQVGNLPPSEVSVALGPVVSKELDYRGTYRFVHEIREAVQLLADSTVAEQVISHTFTLAEAEKAFETASRAGASAKVVLDFRE